MRRAWHIQLQLRFCCKEHLRRCHPIDSEKRGPREGMNPPQVALLVDILLTSGAPWAVPLMLLQIMTEERCGCVTRARVRWLDLASCRLTIEKVTGKTHERSHCPHSMVARSHRILASWTSPSWSRWWWRRSNTIAIPQPIHGWRCLSLPWSRAREGTIWGDVSTLVHTHHHTRVP